MKQIIRRRAVCLLAVLLLVCVPALAADGLIPSGRAVGIRVSTGGLLIVSLTNVPVDGCSFCPAREAGLTSGDLITKADGISTPDIASFSRQLARAAGETVVLTVRRGEITFDTQVTAVRSQEGQWKIGALVKDAVEGIGTVTWYDPQSGICAVLGHGVTENGRLCPLMQGQIFRARITGVQRGAVGNPGNLQGECVGSCPMGELMSNTVCGVFCRCAEGDEENACVPIGTMDSVTTGKATILTTVEGETPREYEISIEAADAGAQTRNFLIRVTDQALIEKTGGIVQGMSGSPILQNGRLIGAVTHVLLGDPTMGYGIGIENMLRAELQTAAPPKQDKNDVMLTECNNDTKSLQKNPVFSSFFC